MTQSVRLLFCSFLLAFYVAQAGRIESETFIRERGKYTFDEVGSSIEVITAKDNKPSLVFDFRLRSKNSTSSNKMSFDDTGILRGDGWFVFVESPGRIWIFDGKNSLSIVERRRTAEKSFTTMIKDFDAQSAALRPVRVKEALPRDVRDALF